MCPGRGSSGGPGLVDMLRQERGALLFRRAANCSLCPPFKLENCPFVTNLEIFNFQNLRDKTYASNKTKFLLSYLYIAIDIKIF